MQFLGKFLPDQASSPLFCSFHETDRQWNISYKPANTKSNENDVFKCVPYSDPHMVLNELCLTL